MNSYLEEEQVENQECSSGCESGWTVYLDHSSFHSAYQHNQQQQMGYYHHHHHHQHLDGARVTTKGFKNNHEEYEDEGDEDLSMVSDASSGPPHLHDDEYNNTNNTNTSNNNNDHYHNNMNGKKKQRGGNVPVQVQDQSFLLDDTASSPFLAGPFSKSNKTRSQPSAVKKNVLEYSLGYSTTQFQVRQPYQEHYDFFHPAPSGNQMQQNQWLEGKGW